MKLEIVQSGRASWLEHTYTKAQREKSRKTAAAALKRLLSACGDSKDPDVLRAFRAWDVHNRIALLLGGSDEDERTNGDGSENR